MTKKTRSSISVRTVLFSLAAIGAVGLIIVAIVGSSSQCNWTGLGPCLEVVPSGTELHRAKTLWDWMDLLIVPIALALGGALLAKAEKTRDRRQSERREALERSLAEDGQREAALQNYIDHITELLVLGNLKPAPVSPEPGSEGERIIRVNLAARGRTLALLRRLDGPRKGHVIQFLWEIQLIRDDNNVIPLDKADLRDAQLAHQNLEGVRLYEVDLEGANLKNAYLPGANLSRSRMRRANVSNASLVRAQLVSGDLDRANLDGAHLTACAADGARFVSASLKGARFDQLKTRDEKQDMRLKPTLVGTDFTAAVLDNAVFEGAWLADAKFVKASLSRVTFRHCDLTDADFTDATLNGAKFDECVGVESCTGLELAGK